MFAGESWLPDRQLRCEGNPIAAGRRSWWPHLYRERLGIPGRLGRHHAAKPAGRHGALYHLRHLPVYIQQLYWGKYRAWHELCWLPPGRKRCMRSEYCSLVYDIICLPCIMSSSLLQEQFFLLPAFILLWFQVRTFLLYLPEYFHLKNKFFLPRLQEDVQEDRAKTSGFVP
jgi:hypothetical protein